MVVHDPVPGQWQSSRLLQGRRVLTRTVALPSRNYGAHALASVSGVKASKSDDQSDDQRSV